MKAFESFMAPWFLKYLRYREKQLGYSTDINSFLRTFDQYLCKTRTDWKQLEPSFFLQFRTDLKQSPQTVNAILAAVSGLFQFLVRRGICEDNPLEGLPRLPTRHFIPFVFSFEQTDALLQAVCKRIRNTREHFLTDVAIYMAILLLARCGMRISEPVRLLRQNYRPEEGTVYIEKSKFKKDRLIPLPKPVWIEIENYLALRDTLCIHGHNPYLLVGAYHQRLKTVHIYRSFQGAVRDIHLYRPKQIVGNMIFGSPTPHSLRHSFAINTLKRIRDQGRNPQHALPVLAAYMGHREYRHTGAYLKVQDANHLQGLIEFAKSRLQRI
jgi:integrase/recombinase XerD